MELSKAREKKKKERVFLCVCASLCLASPHWHRPSDCPWMPGWFPQPAGINQKKAQRWRSSLHKLDAWQLSGIIQLQIKRGILLRRNTIKLNTRLMSMPMQWNRVDKRTFINDERSRLSAAQADSYMTYFRFRRRSAKKFPAYFRLRPDSITE